MIKLARNLFHSTINIFFIVGFTIAGSLTLFGFKQEFGDVIIKVYNKHNKFLVIGIIIILILAFLNRFAKLIIIYFKENFLRPYRTYVDIIYITILLETLIGSDEKYWLFITSLYLFVYYSIFSILFLHEMNFKDIFLSESSNVLDPLDNLAEDTLQRKNLIGYLYLLITNELNKIAVFSITGKPGIGKTSAAKMLRSKIIADSKNKYYVIYFDAHFYNDSYKLLSSYMQLIVQEIKKHEPLTYEFEYIFKKIIEITISQVNRKINIFTNEINTLEELIKQLQKIILKCGRPIILIIDDIDRLNRDELFAVLNVTRLLKDINFGKQTPTLIQILCYHRNYIEQNLHGISLIDKDKAQECLSKIIEKEIPMPFLNDKQFDPVLKNEFHKLIGLIDSEKERQEFESELQRNFSILCKIILTMRQARRIINHASDLYRLDKCAYNLWDVFILTLIQYCYPEVYELMAKYPEWFQQYDNQANEIQDAFIYKISHDKEQNWINNLNKPDYNYYMKLRDLKIQQIYTDCIDQHLIGRLLRFIEITTKLGNYTLEVDAPKNISYISHKTLQEFYAYNNLCHPEHYHRYFHYMYFSNEIPAFEINSLISNIEKDEFCTLFKNKLLKFIKQGYLFKFLDQWIVRTKMIFNEWNIEILKKLAIVSVEITDLIIRKPLETDHETRMIFHYVTTIIRIIAERNGTIETTKLTIELINQPVNHYLPGLLVFHVNHPERGEILNGMVEIDKINIAFADKIRESFLQESIFNIKDKYSLIPIICWLTDVSLKEEYLLRDLGKEPSCIFDIINIYIRVYGLDVSILSDLPFLQVVYNKVNTNIQKKILSEKNKLYWNVFENFITNNIINHC